MKENLLNSTHKQLLLFVAFAFAIAFSLSAQTSLKDVISVSTTNVIDDTYNDLSVLVDGDDNAESSLLSVNRVLIGDGSSLGASIYIDLGEERSDYSSLVLFAHTANEVLAGQDLEIYLATEAQGAFPNADYFDGSHGTLLTSNVDVAGFPGSSINLTGQTFRYIAIRQPNPRYLQLAEVNVVGNFTTPYIAVPSPITISEGFTANQLLHTVSVVGSPEPITSLSLTGTDASDVTINSSNGELRLINAPDFETKNSYSFNIVATDAQGGQTTKPVGLVISDVNESEEGVSLRGVFSISRTKNHNGFSRRTDHMKDQDVTTGGYHAGVNAATDGGATYNGASIFIDMKSEGSNYKSLLLSGWNGSSVCEDLEIYVATEAQGPFPITNEISFDGNHGTLVQSNVTAVGYSEGLQVTPTYVDLSAHTFRYIAIRQTKNGYIGLNQIDVLTDAVSAPIVTASNIYYVDEGAELDPMFLLAKAAVSDAPITNVSLGGIDASKFSVDEEGMVILNEIPDFEKQQSYSLDVIATDENGDIGSITATVHVIDMPEGPFLTSNDFTISTTLRHQHSADLNILTDGLLDNGSTVNPRVLIGDYTNSGASLYIDLGSNRSDIHEFFLKTYRRWNYEAGLDLELYIATEQEGPFPNTDFFDGNHGTKIAENIDAEEYLIENLSSHTFRYIAVRQPKTSFLHTVEVGVSIVPEGITFVSTNEEPLFIDENAEINSEIYTVEAVSSHPITYGLSGADASHFTIDPNSRIITLNDIPDYETKSSYSFNATATDQTGTISLPLTLTVNNAHENGVSIQNLLTLSSAPSAESYDALLDGRLSDNTSNDNYVYLTESGDGEALYIDLGSDRSDLETLAWHGDTRWFGGRTYSWDLEVYVATEAEGPFPQGNLFDGNHGTLISDNFRVADGFDYTNLAGHTIRYIAVRQPISGRTIASSEVDVFVYPSGLTITSETSGNFDENIGSNQIVYSIGASSNVDISNYQISGTDAGFFTVDNSTGNVVLTIDPDFESKSSYTFDATVTDISNATETITVTLQVNDLDDEAPSITITGGSQIHHEQGTTYTELGVSATDNVDGDLTANILITGADFDVNAPGNHNITYNVSDAAGNAATEVTREVTVSDTTLPIITLSGDANVTLELGAASYNDAGATASDNIDGDLTSNIVVNGDTSVDTNTAGSYTITYDVTDAAGNTAMQVTRTVLVADSTAPLISLNGDANITLEQGATYTDLGAIAYDVQEGDISSSIQVNNPVDTNVVGNYTISYNVSDGSGNAAAEVTRTVQIIAAQAPVITLQGDAIINLEIGNSYTDAGATATDNFDGDVTANIVVNNPVNTNTLGSYTITYNVSDALGNAASEVSRTVNIVDTTAPEITVLGNTTINHNLGDAYVDNGAIAFDAVDGNITANIQVTGTNFDVNTPGAYTITYNVSDASGNAANQKTRIVHVADVIAPVITLTGDSNITLEVGTTYNDAGATAMDNLDGDISANIITSGSVNTNILGSYTLNYNVSDAAGNNAIGVNRYITIVDTTAPQLNLQGDANISVEIGNSYTDAGATATDNYDGDLSSSIVLGGDTVDTNTAGIYTLTYTVTDSSGNSSELTRTVTVLGDTTLPEIFLVGDATVSLEIGSSYTDQGATAYGFQDGDLTSSIVVNNPVDVNTLGSYTITYNVSDTSGNNAVQVTRTVNVIDTTAPSITLLGNSNFSIPQLFTFTDPGYTATDNVDGDISNNVTIGGDAVDTNTLGTYIITYDVQDASGNTAQTRYRRVTVITNTLPVITLNGGASITLQQGSTYNELGATATDNEDGDITNNIVITGTVDNTTIGTYQITYSITDSAGNTESVTRTVQVTEPIGPGGISQNMDLWLKANVGGPNWTDQSDNSTTVTQAGTITSGALLNFNETNSLGGVGHYDTNLDINADLKPDLAIISVYIPLAQNSDSPWGADNGGWDRFLVDNNVTVLQDAVSTGIGTSTNINNLFVLGQPSLTTVIFDEDTSDGSFVYVNGNLERTFSSNHGGETTSTLEIGALGLNNRQFKGVIAETIVYSQLLDGTNVRAQIESYLAIKYGLTLNAVVSDYLNSDGVSIFNYDGVYQYDVVGIGKDDSSILDQRISKSVNSGAIVTLSTDTDFTSTNTAHSDILIDGQYLVIGHNNASTASQTTEIENTYLSRIGREWKVENTSSVGTINLKFDGFGNDYILLTDSDGDFSSGTTNAGSLNANGEIAVTLTDGTYFTLAILNEISPGGVYTNLELWLKANEGGTNWTDQSLNTTTVTQSGTVTTGTFVNFNETNSFTGAGHYNTGLNINADTKADLAVISVYIPSINNAGSPWGEDNGDWDRFLVDNNETALQDAVSTGTGTVANIDNLFVPGQPSLTTVIFDEDASDGSFLYLNGNLERIFTSDHGGESSNTLQIGALGSNLFQFNGQIAETIVYSQLLDGTNARAQIESYLAIKYGLTLNATVSNYLSSAGTSVFNYDGTYQNDIAGIGKDTKSTLDQRISKSINSGAIVTLSTDTNFSLANTSHSDILTDGQYLVVGHNNASTASQTTEIENTYASRIGREWKVENTGSVGIINLKFEGFGSDYILLTDSNGDFSSGATNEGNLNANGEIAVTLTDGSYFTLALEDNSQSALQISAKAFLQGAYDNGSGLMRDDLRAAGVIPTTSPYGDGATVNATVFDATGNDAIVDWVFVELRDKADISNVLLSSSALLQKDGDIVDLDGISTVSMNGTPDDYFVVISHRNHIAITTDAVVSLSSTPTTVDFTNNTGIIRGGINAVGEVSTGIYALFSGDTDQNGQVQIDDRSQTITLLGQSGYSNVDADLNGQVQVSDINLILTLIGSGIQF